MSDIYENIVIGNFLFMLGHAIGAHRDNKQSHLFNVNLLQQTPLDTTLSDLLLQSSHFVYLIEFKRTRNSSNKEENKLDQLIQMLSLDKYSHLKDISEKIHWYVETEFDDKQFQSWVVPYLNFMENDAEFIEIVDLIQNIVAQLSAAPLSKGISENIEEYLSMVSRLQGTTDTSSGGLLLFASEGGGLGFIPVSDIRHLTPSREIQSIFSIEHDIAGKNRVLREQEKERKRTIELSKSRGHGLG